jgi:hypothetical protein
MGWHGAAGHYGMPAGCEYTLCVFNTEVWCRPNRWTTAGPTVGPAVVASVRGCQALWPQADGKPCVVKVCGCQAAESGCTVVFARDWVVVSSKCWSLSIARAVEQPQQPHWHFLCRLTSCLAQPQRVGDWCRSCPLPLGSRL